MLRLARRINETGIAYCESGDPPSKRPLYVEHLYGKWWNYQTTES
jgi:hypothetical protein